VGGVAAVLAVLVAAAASSGLQSALSIIVGLVFAFFGFVVLYAISQLIYLVLDIEENTRELRQASKKGE